MDFLMWPIHCKVLVLDQPGIGWLARLSMSQRPSLSLTNLRWEHGISFYLSAVTETLSLGVYKEQKFTSHGSGGCVFTWQEEEWWNKEAILSPSHFSSDNNLFKRKVPSWSKHLPKPHLPALLHWGSTWTLGTHSDISMKKWVKNVGSVWMWALRARPVSAY
jgi:hypothetical protein